MSNLYCAHYWVPRESEGSTFLAATGVVMIRVRCLTCREERALTEREYAEHCAAELQRRMEDEAARLNARFGL